MQVYPVVVLNNEGVLLCTKGQRNLCVCVRERKDINKMLTNFSNTQHLLGYRTLSVVYYAGRVPTT